MRVWVWGGRGRGSGTVAVAGDSRYAWVSRAQIYQPCAVNGNNGSHLWLPTRTLKHQIPPKQRKRRNCIL